MNTIKAWWWSDGVLGYGDGRAAEVGIIHTVEGDPAVCEHGLHGSVRVLDALNYANSTRVWRVELGGKMDIDSDKIAAQSRRYLWTVDAAEVLPAFVQVVLHMAELRDAPNVVREYLETGDPKLRDAAWRTTWDTSTPASYDLTPRVVWWRGIDSACLARVLSWVIKSISPNAVQFGLIWDKCNDRLETMIREARDE